MDSKFPSSSNLGLLEEIYRQLRAPEIGRTDLLSRFRKDDVLRVLLTEPEGKTETAMTLEQSKAFQELRVCLLVSEPSAADQLHTFEMISSSLLSLLRQNTPESRDAAGHLIGCLLLAFGAVTKEIIERVRYILGSLTGRQEGSLEEIRKYEWTVSGRYLPKLSQLLDVGLFTEVLGFLDVIDRIDADVTASPSEPMVSVGCVVSRKGGVGKSTVTLATALASITTEKKDSICIFDLDLTGPMWQYVLLTGGRDLNGCDAVKVNLNQLVEFDQPDDDFQFLPVSSENLMQCLLWGEIPFVKERVGLISFADLPRTNRFLARQIANNPRSFGEFLESVIAALSKEFSLILIDNSPGFDYHTQVAYATTRRFPRGCPVAVSTPFPADLRGTMLELADLKFIGLESRVTPLWVINKVDKETQKFFEGEINAVKLTQQLPSYRGVLPDAPVLGRLLPTRKGSQNVVALPFDEQLAVSSANLLSGSNWGEAGIKDFLKSSVFLQFKECLNRSPEPLPFWS